MAETNWWDNFTTRLGDVLIAPQQPFGPPVADPTAGSGSAPTQAQRAAMIGGGLLTLGSALSQGARQRAAIGESLGAAWNALQQGGMERAKGQLQMGLLGNRLAESQRVNQTRDMLRRMRPPEGVAPDMWPVMVDGLSGADMLRLLMAARRGDARGARTYGGGVPPGSANPGTGQPQGAPAVIDLGPGNRRVG